MRTDFKLDNKKVPLPNASTLGFGLRYAKRGNWIRTPGFSGRVLGRVRVERRTLLYVFIADPMAVRWVNPDDVFECKEVPPHDLIHLLMMSFAKPKEVIKDLQDYFGEPLSLGEK